MKKLRSLLRAFAGMRFLFVVIIAALIAASFTVTALMKSNTRQGEIAGSRIQPSDG